MQQPSVHANIHITMILVWTFLFAFAVTTLKESIVFLVFMSWYANWIGHIAAWQASRAEKEAEYLRSEDIGRIAKAVKAEIEQ